MRPEDKPALDTLPDETSITLDLSDAPPTNIVGNGPLTLQENVAVIVPTTDLAIGTLVMLAGARVVLLAGLIACAVLAAQTLIRFRRGDAFTSPTIKGLSRLCVVGIIAWTIYLAMLHFGANMVIRDLEIEADSASGLWGSDHFWYGFIVLLMLTIFTEALRQGKKNQDELEGLV